MTLQGFSNRSLQGLSNKLQAFSSNPLLDPPSGICVNSGNVYVTYGLTHKVIIFSTTGTYIDQFGTFGSGDGQLNAPGHIVTDGSNLFISDNTRIIKYEFDGTFVSSITKPTSTQFHRLVNTNYGVAVSYRKSDGSVYLTTYDYDLNYVSDFYTSTGAGGSVSFSSVNSLVFSPNAIVTFFWPGDSTGLTTTVTPFGIVSISINYKICNNGNNVYYITNPSGAYLLRTFDTSTSSPFAVSTVGTPATGILSLFFYGGEIYCTRPADDKITVINPSDASTIREWTA